MLKVISLDFWNTIVDTSNSEKRRHLRLDRFYNLCRIYRPEIEKDKIELAIKNSIIWFEEIWEKEHRTVLSEDIINRILDELKFMPSQQDFDYTKRIFECGVLEAEPNLAPEIESVLEKLSGKFQFGIISDTHFSPGRVLRQLLEQKNILHYFSAFSFSDEQGVSKPHHKMYQNIMSHFDCRPSEMIHIGDMNRTDISGAKSLGIRAILYTGINNKDSKTLLADFESNSWMEIDSILSNLQ